MSRRDRSWAMIQMSCLASQSDQRSRLHPSSLGFSNSKVMTVCSISLLLITLCSAFGARSYFLPSRSVVDCILLVSLSLPPRIIPLCAPTSSLEAIDLKALAARLPSAVLSRSPFYPLCLLILRPPVRVCTHYHPSSDRVPLHCIAYALDQYYRWSVGLCCFVDEMFVLSVITSRWIITCSFGSQLTSPSSND